MPKNFWWAAAILCLAATPISSPVLAAPQQLQVGQTLPRFSNLKPGIRRYLRHREIDGILRSMDIWVREIRFDQRDGKLMLHIVQTWTGPAAAPHTQRLDSWFETNSFRPLTHERLYQRAEEVRNEGFRFLPDKVVPLETTGGNIHKTLDIATPQQTYNFETDMEFLQTLPLAKGYEASINFYHPGGAPPADYVFKVAGSEALAGPGGTAIDCWLVTTDYNRSGQPPARFWLRKSDQLVVKVEQPAPDGSKVVKTLLY